MSLHQFRLTLEFEKFRPGNDYTHDETLATKTVTVDDPDTIDRVLAIVLSGESLAERFLS